MEKADYDMIKDEFRKQTDTIKEGLDKIIIQLDKLNKNVEKMDNGELS